MSIIYSFLQKRKLHENQYGFIMVFTAYLIAALMLALGSDTFYNIKTSAAGVSRDTEEETNRFENVQPLNMNVAEYPLEVKSTQLVNPYGLSDLKQSYKAETVHVNTKADGDTVWLLGSAMDETSFNSLMEETVILKTPAKKLHDTEEKRKASTKSPSKAVKKVKTVYGKFTENEVTMLERIVEAEASGEDMVGKVLIVNVILNRVKSGEFPDTIKGVIFQKVRGEYQFSPIANDRYWSVNISQSTKNAVKRALEGEDYSEGALYFMAKKRANAKNAEWFDDNLDWLFKHGGHEFYKNR